MAGRKMAKSAGNFQRVTELAEEGIDPLAFRYLVLTSRYGHKLNYSDESIAAAASALSSLRGRLAALGPAGVRAVGGSARAHCRRRRRSTGGHGRWGGGVWRRRLRDHRSSARAGPIARGRALHDRFVAALDDDLDLPAALVTVREILRSDLPADERRWLVLDADAVLGLDLHGVRDVEAAGAVPDGVEALLRDRDAARAARDYARADALRDEIGAAVST